MTKKNEVAKLLADVQGQLTRLSANLTEAEEVTLKALKDALASPSNYDGDKFVGVKFIQRKGNRAANVAALESLVRKGLVTKMPGSHMKKIAQYGLAASVVSAAYKMGQVVEGEDTYWPESREWDLWVEDEYMANSDMWNGASYQLMSVPSVFVNIDIGNLALTNPKPATYNVTGMGLDTKGKLRSHKDVQPLLDKVKKMAEKAQADQERAIEKFGTPDWENSGLMSGDLVLTREYGDHGDMDVAEIRFDSVDNALASGDPEEAILTIQPDIYRKRDFVTHKFRYRTLKDMEKIVKDADRLARKVLKK